jgi:hypothetical protein
LPSATNVALSVPMVAVAVERRKVLSIVQVTDVRPVESVVVVFADTLPVPPFTRHVTVAPATGLPLALVT